MVKNKSFFLQLYISSMWGKNIFNLSIYLSILYSYVLLVIYRIDLPEWAALTLTRWAFSIYLHIYPSTRNLYIYPSTRNLYIYPSTRNLHIYPSTRNLYIYPSTRNLYIYPSTRNL